MERHLSLIKTDYQDLEKRVFPRFPFGQMVFKDIGIENLVYEVRDISLTGMQVTFRDGAHHYSKGSKITGRLQWRNSFIDVKGKIEWASGNSIGLSFDSNIKFEIEMKNFLSYDNIVSHIKPIHKTNLDIEIPNDLKYWLRSDGVLELFVWELKTIGISRFQVLIMEHFIEWTEGVGVKTGKVMTQRNLETPLGLEDEFIFQIDDGVNISKVEIALGIIKKISEEQLPLAAREFLIYKLGG
jgi:hypothetical protein